MGDPLKRACCNGTERANARRTIRLLWRDSPQATHLSCGVKAPHKQLNQEQTQLLEHQPRPYEKQALWSAAMILAAFPFVALPPYVKEEKNLISSPPGSLT